MLNKRYHSIKPGEFILDSDEPVAVEYRKELMEYLKDYPPGPDKNDLKRRLRSYTESGFYSACFELFLHHILVGRCQKVNPHPDLPNITTPPEFGVAHSAGDFYLEATLALESEEYQAQEQRLLDLVDTLRDIKGNVILWAQPVTHLPADFPLDSVRDFLNREIGRLGPADLQLPKTLTFQANFNKCPVIIDFEIMGADQESCDSVVQAWGAPEAREVTTHYRIRRRIRCKAGKYGNMRAPYVIAVWPRTEFPLTREVALRALYGDEQIRISLESRGVIGRTRVQNGAFNTMVSGNLLNHEVSAVALYREEFSRASYECRLYIYHNPYTSDPLPEEIFLNFPQFVFRTSESGDGRMQWLNGVDPWDE